MSSLGDRPGDVITVRLQRWPVPWDAVNLPTQTRHGNIISQRAREKEWELSKLLNIYTNSKLDLIQKCFPFTIKAFLPVQTENLSLPLKSIRGSEVWDVGYLNGKQMVVRALRKHWVAVCMWPFFPVVNSCSVKNGGCEHRCVDLGNEQYKCECRSNYQLKRDGKHCECESTCILLYLWLTFYCSNIVTVMWTLVCVLFSQWRTPVRNIMVDVLISAVMWMDRCSAAADQDTSWQLTSGDVKVCVHRHVPTHAQTFFLFFFNR